MTTLIKTWQSLILVLISATLVLFTATGFVAQAEPSRWFTEWSVPTPNSEPLHILSVTDDTIYFTERLGGNLGRLNPSNNSITEWAVGGSPHFLILGRNSILYADQAGKIGKFNPGTNKVTFWSIPNGEPLHLVQAGNFLYFTDFGNSGSIGRLNLSNGQLRQWAIPTGTTRDLPNGIDTDMSGRYIAFMGDAKLGILDTATGTFRQWLQPGLAIPSAGHVKFFGRYVFFGGNLSGGAISRLNTVTNTIRSWKLPTYTGIGDIDVESDSDHGVILDFVENNGNNVGRLNTAQDGVESTVAPTITTVTPIDTTTLSSTITALKVSTTVVPTRINVIGVSTGPFVEWPIPTVGSTPGGLDKFPDGGLIFTERDGNKIGLMTKE